MMTDILIEHLRAKTYESDGIHGIFEVDRNPEGPAAANRIEALEAEKAAAVEKAGELQRLFDLQWAADMRAVARWQAGDELPHCGSLRPLLTEVLQALDDDTGRMELADRLRAELAETAPGGRPRTHPDRADLVVWLLGQLDEAASQAEAMGWAGWRWGERES